MSNNLSYINTIKDLESAEDALRLRIKQRERMLQQQAAELPGKVTKNIVRKTLPFLIGAGVAAFGTRIIYKAFLNRSAKKLAENKSIPKAPLMVIKNSPIVPLLLPMLGKLMQRWVATKAQRKVGSNKL